MSDDDIKKRLAEARALAEAAADRDRQIGSATQRLARLISLRGFLAHAKDRALSESQASSSDELELEMALDQLWLKLDEVDQLAVKARSAQLRQLNGPRAAKGET